MSAEVEESDRLAPGVPHPRETPILIGHDEAEQQLLSAWRSRRLPHAILIGGPEGIGKATLAYRIARFVLARGTETASERGSLALEARDPTSRQVQALAHPDLMVLRRVWNDDTKKLRTEIRVEDVRRTISFFGSTSAYGGYRVCIVDAAEDLNRAGANALLKILEEPPEKSLLLIVSHSPGRLLPTIRSRCRRLQLRPLSDAEVVSALEELARSTPELPRKRFEETARGSGGSVRKALRDLLGDQLDLRASIATLLDRLPAVDSEGVHALSDQIRGSDELAVFAETVGDWLAARATSLTAPRARLARMAEAWEKVRRAAVETESYNLDRKPMVFQVFSDLAEAARR